VVRSRLRRSVSLWGVLVAIAALLAGGVPAAHAQSDASPPPSAVVEQARTARAQGRLPEAIDAYGRAYLEGGDANILFELAECQRAAGQDAAAIRSFQNYLRRAPRGPHHRSAEKQIDELQAAASQASPAAGAAPANAPPVAPAAPPHANALRPPVTPVMPPHASVPAQQPAPTLPPAVAAVPASTAPSASAPGGSSSPATIELTAAAAPRATPNPPLPRWVPWSLAATTVLLASAATWAGFSANDRFDELHQSCGQTSGGCDAAATSDLKDRARRANILWALTGVAALGTGITVYVNTSAAGLSGLWRY